MSMRDVFRTWLTEIGRFLAAQRRLGQFTCSDCEQWTRCALPPDARCGYRVAQIASGDWQERRRAAMPQEPW